jgi:hypothetical protein
MLKVYCDFNDGTEDERYWILWYDGKPLEDQVDRLKLEEGQRVALYQDGEFIVEGTLLFHQTHPWFLGAKLCAKVDWQTMQDL